MFDFFKNIYFLKSIFALSFNTFMKQIVFLFQNMFTFCFNPTFWWMNGK